MALLGMVLIFLFVSPARAQDNRIDSVSVVSESSDEIILDVVYVYNGDQGNNVALSAVMATDGESSAYYAVRPARVEPSRHRARVWLGVTRGAPEVFFTNQLEVSMYGGKRRF